MAEVGEEQRRHSALVERIAHDLRTAGFDVRMQPIVGGLQPDILAEGPTGSSLVIDVKTWEPRGGNTARAIHQADLIQEATGADAAFVVMDKLSRNYRDKRVVTPDGLISALRQEVAFQEPAREPPTEQGEAAEEIEAVEERAVFAAMPFDRRFDDTYFVAMTYAAERVGAHCVRIDMEEYSGNIVAEMHERIRESVAVIADLSGANPNVLYEAGYAHALDKPTVHVCSTPLEELPFDVRNWNTLPYELGQTSQLRNRLANRLRAALS